MTTKQVSESAFREDFRAFADLARHETIIVTRADAESLVVMSSAEWQRLRRSERRVGRADELPDEWIAAVEAAKVSSDFAALDHDLD